LRDLEWEGHIRDARHAGLETIRNRVFSAILVIRLSLGYGGRQIWDLSIRRIDDGALSGVNSIGSCMRFDVSVEGVIENLPDSTQIRLSIRGSRNNRTGRSLTSGTCCLATASCGRSLSPPARLAAGSQ
jgi:hypothetical protein